MAAPEKTNDEKSIQLLNTELIATVNAMQKTIQELREELALYKRKLFGRSSERHVEDESQLRLFQDDTVQPVEVEDEPEEEEPGKKRRRRKKKSEKLPAHLLRTIIEADVAEDKRICPCCGDEMPIIATDIAERLDLVPAKMFVIEIRRPKRACSKCKEVIVQVPAGEEPGGVTTPVTGSDYGFGVYTQMIVSKFADHMPLYRCEDLFARAGVLIPRNTQFGMLANTEELITPFLAFMIARVLSGRVLGVDDTTVRMQDAALPGKMRTARFWLYRGQDDNPYNVFEFHDSRGRDGPASFLSGFTGHASVDAYGVHDGVYLGSGGRILASCCNAHGRRKFVEAKPNDAVAAVHALSFYRGLYEIEDRLRDATVEERLAVRQQESVPLAQSFHDWLIATNDDRCVLPKSSLSKAVRYVLNQWNEMTAYLGNGELSIDNNATENELRRLTIGRKNWLFVGSSNGGRVAASMYTLVSSAARHHLDVWAYVNDVLRQLASGSEDYESLLPDVWGQSHPDATRPYRDAEQQKRKLTTQQRRVRRRLGNTSDSPMPAQSAGDAGIS
jgi:transposase